MDSASEITKFIFLSTVEEAPTADVAPKSEVAPKRDRYYIEEGKPPVLIETSDNRRSKIAREIFEEIEENIFENLNRNYADRYFNLIVKIAELKKKYTEGEK
jgi:hypothetical protein